jgi:hypothetical protein
MALPGVVGTALGERAGKPCIMIFVAEMTTKLLSRIPATIDGHPVDVQETGEISALAD